MGPAEGRHDRPQFRDGDPEDRDRRSEVGLGAIRILRRPRRGPELGHQIPADHGYFLGPTHKLEIPRKTLEPLLPVADAIMVTRGVVRTSVDPAANVPIVLRVSGGASVLNEDLSNEKVTTSMKEAVRLNASAVALSIFIGAAHEH